MNFLFKANLAVMLLHIVVTPYVQTKVPSFCNERKNLVPMLRSILKYYGELLNPDRLKFLCLSILWAEGYPGNSSNPNVGRSLVPRIPLPLNRYKKLSCSPNTVSFNSENREGQLRLSAEKIDSP